MDAALEAAVLEVLRTYINEQMLQGANQVQKSNHKNVPCVC